MVRSLTPLLWATLSLLAFNADSAEPRPSIGIFMDFDVPPGRLALDAMKHEVESIMKSTGLVMDWRSLKSNLGQEAFSGLLVLRFKGKCQVQPWKEPDAPPDGRDVRLGSSQVSAGRVLPFTEVECEQVRKTIPYGDFSASEQERQSALGRALGRVVAHELYHVLAKTTGHAVDGLAKATQSFRDLVTGSLRFRQSDSEAIRQGVAAGFALSVR